MKSGNSACREVVFVGTWADVALLNGLLEREGIETVVAADRRATRFRRAVYVLDSTQLESARDIVRHFVSGTPLENPRSYRSWRCAECNELIEGQFAACWKCGAARKTRVSNV
jgi:hypothetical protein